MPRQLNQDVVKSGSGNGLNPLSMILRSWQRKKEIDYRFGKENELMDRQHELAKERIVHKAMYDTVANGASKAISNYFDTNLENTKSQNRILETKETGRQTRLTRTHGGKRDYADAEKLTKGLYENTLDPSKGISPLTSINMQNVGPLLGGNPLLGVNPAKDAGKNTGPVETPVAGGKKRKRKTNVAPIAPQIGTDATPDKGFEQLELPFGDTDGPSVTKPTVKKPRTPRPKKTGTEDGQ